MTRAAGTQYSVGSPTRVCAATGRELTIGSKFVAALCQPRESDDYVRLDYSEDEWRSGTRPGGDLLMLGCWRGVVSEDGGKRRLLVDDESLIELFEQSDEGEQAESPERRAFRFVLALILMRKRLLVHEGSRGTTMLVRARGVPKPPEGPELQEVDDPGMTPDLVAKVTEQLKAVLSDAGPSTGSSAPGAGGAA